MPALEGGAALPVTTGGSGKTEGGAAVPVYVVSGGPVIGQRARRVVVVTSGPVEGGAALPVYDAGASALYTDEPALPVYVVSGSLGVDPALAYTNKIKALNPIAYWPLAEASGTTITDESSNGRNGVYSNTAGVLNGITLGQPGIGDGRTSALYNGATGFGNIFSTSFRDAFNGAEGTIAAWFKVSGAGVWTDATARRIVNIQVDGSNVLQLRRSATNNIIDFLYVAGGTTKIVQSSSVGGSIIYVHLALTWSDATDQLKAYINGAQVGATQTGLGTWAGVPASTTTVLGSLNTTPAQLWSGNLAHIAVWNTPLSAVQIATLAVVP